PSPALRSSAPHPDWSGQNAAPIAPLKRQSWPEYASIDATMVHAAASGRLILQRSSVQMRVDPRAPVWQRRRRFLKLPETPFGSIGRAAGRLVMLTPCRLA